MSMGNRIKQRLAELGWRQVDLLDRVPELSPGTLSAIIKRGGIRSVFAKPIAHSLGVTLEWLTYGTGVKEATFPEHYLTAPSRLRATLVNTEPGPDIRGCIPLISWVQAGAFCNAVDLFEPGDAEEWLPAIQLLGPHAYALRVKGDSMTAPYGLSYPEGVVVFVDPDAPVTNGCRVIAKLPSSDEATFKVYAEDAGQRFLKPLNPQYPTIPMTPDMQLCGVVRGTYRPE